MAGGFQEARGKVLASYQNTRIVQGFPNNFYETTVAAISDEAQTLAASLAEAITGKIAVFSLEQRIGIVPPLFAEAFSKRVVQEINLVSGLQKIPPQKDLERLRIALAQLVSEFFPAIKQPEKVGAKAIDDSVGFGPLADLVADNALEEIMVNGRNKPIFVVHRRFGMCQTNRFFSDDKSLQSLVQRIARTVNKPFDESFPLLDARLPDGSRVNATFSSVSSAGTSLTIRKFARANFSIVDLIMHNTVSSELAAFLWVMIEGFGIQPMNLIVTGGTGTGKTTTLNCLAAFVPASQRIVSIEDTLELDLVGRKNWVALESKPKTRATDAVSMEELLQNALRMRPDRLIVGEVRGIEAQTLFVAMDTGHDGTLGTVHANTARELLLRLRSEPMNVPESMLGLLDLVVVQVRMFLPGKGLVRRIAQVAEVSSMAEKPLSSTVFDWNRKTDTIHRTDTPSHVLQVLSDRTSLSKNEIKKEIQLRQKILEWMMSRKILSHDEVHRVIQRYYLNPQRVIDEILSSK